MMRNLALTRSVKQVADPEEAWIVTDLLIRDLDELARNDGSRLLVTLIDPFYKQVEQPLRELLASRSIPYLDVSGIYTDDYESYWVKGHWNRKGHALGAQALAEKLLPYLLEPPSGPP